MSGAMLPLPRYAFMAWCLVKHRDNFTFYLLPFNGQTDKLCISICLTKIFRGSCNIWLLYR